MVEVTSKTPKGGWKDGRRTNRGRYVNGEEIAEINRKFRALEAERDALRTAGDALAEAVERALPDPDEMLALNVLAGNWWAVTAKCA
jgi:hypothetical protein